MRPWICGFVIATFLSFMTAHAALIDMGDLSQCDYPTLYANPGHSISGIAWLGECITADSTPHILDADSCDDGVIFLDMPWTPCQPAQVQVTVTGGPMYPAHAAQGGHLYLNGWKDGNLDGDFCDVLCNGLAPEWIVQDVLVTPGTAVYTFVDPGVTDMGIYQGILRFRLTRNPLGPLGFGLIDTVACPEMCGGTFAYDSCGEVEDYMIRDLQLDVELSEFSAVGGDGEVDLTWRTASESGNDHFEIERDGELVARVRSQGDTPSGNEYRYTDRNVENEHWYNYTLSAVDVNGVRSELSTQSAAPTSSTGIPSSYALLQNYPNPFNPTTQIVFDVAETGFVVLKVHNLMGQEVATLVNGNVSAGRHIVSFNGTNLPSGVYLCSMTAGGHTLQIKMLLMK